MRLLLGFEDVLTLDAWLDYFEALGHDVDGAMAGEDLSLVAPKFRPDVLVCSYRLKGEADGLGLFYGLSAIPKLSKLKLVLVYDERTSGEKLKKGRFLDGSGILGFVEAKALSFEQVQRLLEQAGG